MNPAKKIDLVSVEDYLAGELLSPVKHEYVGGFVYARADTRNLHNIIVANTTGSIHTRLRGKTCRPFNSDTKVRIRLPSQFRFYYPDALVVCRQNAASVSYQDEPVVIFEVLSKGTRRIDEGEKKDAYLTIPSLGVYALIEQETAAVVVHRRTSGGFVREVYKGLQAVIPLAEIGIDLPLAEVYETVEFTPESDPDSADLNQMNEE
jgi:Uma2 family endonuclease